MLTLQEALHIYLFFPLSTATALYLLPDPENKQLYNHMCAETYWHLYGYTYPMTLSSKNHVFNLKGWLSECEHALGKQNYLNSNPQYPHTLSHDSLNLEGSTLRMDTRDYKMFTEQLISLK